MWHMQRRRKLWCIHQRKSATKTAFKDTQIIDKADKDFKEMLKELKKTMQMELKEGIVIMNPQIENINTEIKWF